MNLTRVLKEKDRRKNQRESKKNALQKFQNHLYYIMGPQILDHILVEKRLAKIKSTDDVIQPAIDDHIVAIHRLGDELLSQGDYIEVINYFKRVSNDLSAAGLYNEAEQFENRSREIYNLLKLRADFLTLLEHEKLSKNSIKITFLYQEIIEISKKLNDTFWIEKLQKELEEYQRELDYFSEKINTNRSMSNKNVLNSKFIRNLEAQTPLVIFEDNETTLNLRENVLKFALEKLLQKRENLEQEAISFEKNSNFKAAAQCYEKCEGITSQIIRLGIPDEQEALENYRNRRLNYTRVSSP